MRRLLALLLLAAASSSAADIAPFTSDGCSLFPDGRPADQSLWLECCVRHDLAYWKGGAEQERLAADLALEQCVARVGEPEVARLMLQGVRAGGSPHYLTSYRWGYGWPFGRGYQSLSNDELAQVKKRLEELETMLRETREALVPKE
ncbi:MAG TPA: hypothetical protein VHK24_09150 [Steroidobacter sp.]|nr:hypothetical protein [Steroidobacter sp.]